MNSKHRFILINRIAIEFVLLNIVLLSFLFFRLPNFSFDDPNIVRNIIGLAAVYNVSWLFIILYIRDNEFYFNPDYRYLRSLMISLFFFVGIVATLVILLKMRSLARSSFILPIFIFSFLNLIGHQFLLKFFRKRGANLFSDTLLLSSGSELAKLDSFRNFMLHHGYNIVGCLEGQEGPLINGSDIGIKGKIQELPEVLNKHSIDEIFIATASLNADQITESIKVADNFGVRVKLIPENPIMIAKNYKAITMGDLAVFKLRQSPLDNFSMTIAKRLFDFFFALFAIILLSPIYILIAILIFLDSRGPILYAPYRKGEGGKSFRCYKFRTMSVNDNPLSGTKSTIPNDPRITSVGRILRKADLDELPQFFNVLKGDMSVIGPRPHRINLQDHLRKHVSNYMVRSYVKPGITGWAQVNGWRGTMVTDEQKNERVKHDLWYIENWSFWLDLKIIFLTLFGKHHKKAF